MDFDDIDDVEIKTFETFYNCTSKSLFPVILNRFDMDADLGRRPDLSSFLLDFYFVTNANMIVRDMPSHWL